jgi:hypothetical protein
MSPPATTTKTPGVEPRRYEDRTGTLHSRLSGAGGFLFRVEGLTQDGGVG